MNLDKNRKIEEILSSLDHCDRVSAPDFFYTRLIAKMESSLTNREPKRSFILRPVFALTVLAAVLIMNAVVIFQKNPNTDIDNSTALSESETIQSLAVEYSLNDNSTILFDINQEK